MKKHNWIKLTLAAGAAAGTAMGIISRLQKREQEEEPAVPAGPGSLITAQARAQLTERIGSRLPPEATALVMAEDRGELARCLAPSCRMLFSANADGTASPQRAAWPRQIIRAACDPECLWLAEDSLDAAVLVNTLQCCEDTGRVLAQMARAIRTGGFLSLVTTLRPEPFTQACWSETMALLGLPDRHGWTRDELRGLLQAAGWEICEETEHPSGLPLVQMLCCKAEKDR